MPACGKELAERLSDKKPACGRTTQKNPLRNVKVHSSDHIHHAIHHKITIKTPSFTSSFPPKTPQNPAKKAYRPLRKKNRAPNFA
jgi:hypothetical protein